MLSSTQVARAVASSSLDHLPEANVLINPAAGSGDTLLHVAAQLGSVPLIERLVSQSTVNLEVANRDGKRPLHEAAQAGQLDAARYLVKAGCLVDAIKRADWTPLMMAATKDNLDMISFLVEEAGADTSLRNKDGWTPFHIAAREGHLAIVKYFLNHCGPEVVNTQSNNRRSSLHTVALHGHVTVMKLLVESSNKLINSRDACGSTPFMDAVRSSSVDMCQTLINNGADPLMIDELGRNALHLAAESGSAQIIEYLVKQIKLNVNAKESRYGTTALHIAAKEGACDSIKMLLQLSADKMLTDFKGRTPLQIAKLYLKSNTYSFLE